MEKISLDNKTILVTGHAGFIGSNLVHRLFSEMKGGTIVGIDNMNSYYDGALKEYRLNELDKAKHFRVARVYSEYRLRHELLRKQNSTDKKQ